MTPTPEQAVVISPLRRRHLDVVTTIEAASHPNPWTRNLFEGELGRPDRHYVVARTGDRIVGHAGLIVIAGDGHIANVTVDPERRDRKLATRLVLELVDDALGRGVDRLTLEVRVSNEAAIALYRRFGFVSAGVRTGYYDDGEDAFVMWLHDLAGADARRRLDEIRAALPDPTVRHGFDVPPDERRPVGFRSAARSAPPSHPTAGNDGHPGRMG